LWVDELVHQVSWTQVINKLSTEWQEFILLATVVLNANVAFLSIQSVDNNGDSRSPTQLASYFSILASIGSIILGLLLVRQNRTYARLDPAEVAIFLKKRAHPVWGLEALAVLYSLPYSLLIWSVVGFLLAFSLMCFDNSDSSTRILVGVTWVAVATLIIWCVLSGWERQSHDWVGGYLLLRAWDRVRDLLRLRGDAEDKTPPRQWEWQSILIRRTTWDSQMAV